MLESLAAWVLNTYIGEYLENLNTDQLSVALLQGQVELENVPLKRTALRKFDIPLTVKAGVLGKLTLSVPLTHMRSAPWVVKISDLHVLLEPSENKYDVEFDERYEQGKKQQQLEALEAFHKKQLLETAGLPTTGELSATGDGHGGGWLTYGASLVSTIVENIQLILTNVHIRYEDPHTLGGERSFTSGARIKRVTVQTTNAFWKPGFVQPSDSANLYKVLELSGLSVYWNSGQQCSGDIATYRELMSLLVPDTAKDNCYILEPVSAQVRMEKNTSKFPLKSKPAIPRFRFDLEPDKVAIEMTKQQLAELRLLTREWGRYDRARRHRKWRPKEGVHGHARAWWNFAYERLLDETRRAREKRTIHYKTTRAKHLNAYCRAYRRRLEQFLDQAERRQKVPADSSDMRASSSTHSHKGDELDAVLMKQIENDAQYTYEELHLFRDTVFRRVLDERAARRKSSSQSAPSDDMFVSIGDELETPRSSRSEHDFRQVQPERPPQSAGLYGWISSWFSGSTDAQAMSSSTDLDAEKFVSTSDLSSWSAFSDQPRPELPPYLRRLEKQLEEEIMDVLNESWDDSTMLRRDALLAQIRIRMKTFTIRFVDEEVTGGLHTQASLTKILALELSDAYAQFRLSPRHHSTAISLTVGDLSVQRLQVHKSQWSGSTDQEDSLMYGFNEGDMNTTVLFALGKSPSVKRNHAGPIGVHGREPPLLRMVYERRAPRLVARHTLDAEFSPITIMYHEDAPVGLSNLFETDIQLLEEFVSSATNKPIVSDLSTHVFATIRVPEVTVELRSKQLTFGGDQLPGALSSHGAAGKPFACAHFHKVALGVANTDDWITEIKIGVAGVELEDLLETTEAMLSARYLLKAGCFELPVAQLVQSQYLSSSCPDLSSAGDDVAPHSSSLPPRMRGTRESREEPISVHTPTFTPERTPKISRKTSLTTMDGFGEANQSQCFVTVSLIDSRHPQFDSRYSKVHRP
uniref:Vacuolar protein sorting 13D n=1 Tax=Plectus sambesii TaxID=2011161 RepID=A0A914XD20_9BILA